MEATGAWGLCWGQWKQRGHGVDIGGSGGSGGNRGMGFMLEAVEVTGGQRVDTGGSGDNGGMGFMLGAGEATGVKG